MKTRIICLIEILLLFWMFSTYAYGYGYTIIVRVVHVTPEWVPFASTDGWTSAVTVKESNYLKYFEIAIWDETASIHLYEFPNSYNPSFGTGKTDAEKIAYREQYALQNFSGMPTSTSARSAFIKDAFKSFIDIIAARYPNSNQGLVFNGHGTVGGELFGMLVAPKHAQEILQYWAEKIESKLAFVDMGGPCSKGGYTDLNTFCPFSEYYIASDLPNGGYSFDDWTIDKYNETNPDFRYHDLIENNATLLEVLTGRINLKRKAYEYSINNMTQNKTEQANYLYSCQLFKYLYDKVEPISSSLPSYDDLRSKLQSYSSDYLSAFDATIVKKADNKDFFAWEVTANGIKTPNTLWFGEGLSDLTYPILFNIAFISKNGLCNSNTPCYSSIQDGIDAAENGITIKSTSDNFTENIVITSDKNLIIQGGCDATYSSCDGFTLIDGTLTIASGTLKIKNIVIK